MSDPLHVQSSSSLGTRHVFRFVLLKNVSTAWKRCCHHASCQVMTTAGSLPDMTFGIRPGSDQTPVLLTEAWLLSFSKERCWSFVRVNIGFVVTLSPLLRVLVVPNCFNFWRMALIPFSRTVPKYSPVSELYRSPWTSWLSAPTCTVNTCAISWWTPVSL